MTHTPGPWTLDPNITYGAPEVMSNGRRIAKVVYSTGSEDDEVHDNARLIAAAPDLLEAGELLHQALVSSDNVDHLYKEIYLLRLAIAKAKGGE